MDESEWPELAGKEVRNAGQTWQLTGEVTIKDTGTLLEVAAFATGDVRHPTAGLRFGIETPPASLNPGDVGGHFDRLERDEDQYYLVVKTDPRVYRYELQGMTRR